MAIHLEEINLKLNVNVKQDKISRTIDYFTFLNILIYQEKIV